MKAQETGERGLSAPRPPVELRRVTRRYGDLVVLDRFDLALDEGGVTVVMGANGSGKTTVARLVLGLDAPDRGTVVGLDGRRPAAAFQENRLCEHLTAVDNVALVLDRPDHDDVVGQLKRAGLIGEVLTRPVRTLSGGQRRRVAIVRALAGDADLIVMDEPFTGIDARSKGRLMDYVQERLDGRTTLLITHDTKEARRFGARVVKLGRVAKPGR